MNPSRVAKNILRRLSFSDNLFQQSNANYSQGCSTPKIIENKNKTIVSLVSTQLRKMSSDVEASTSTQHPTNRLSLEKSPYLLQHATNPVDWYPWCEEAFEKARKENKLIFLSVGYSTCHWCHVMEKESFENESVAQIMNEFYVNIKVDREERPDIDKVYMSFIHATSGSGGWPMSVFLTPNLEPITGGTYFPPEDKWGRPGFKTILKNIAEHWKTDQAGILDSGKNIIAVLKKVTEGTMGSKTMDFPIDDCWRKCLNQFNKSYETNYGGFSSAPKFPQPSNFNFLFHLYSRDKNSAAGKHCLNMCLHTLTCMANGGIHDHVANGFARYSTDAKWHVPHFEKMLYDQAQLVISYCDAYAITKEKFYSDIIHDILLYVSRDLSHDSGGFYSAEDADSNPDFNSKEKREGAFCVWEYNEIYEHLTGKAGNISHAEIFCHHFNVKKNGNVSSQQDPHNELQNKNVLIVFGSVAATAEYFHLPIDQITEILESCKKILFEVRLKRPKPHLDSKILTAWNGLMISGFARAGFVLNNDAYVERAIDAGKFVKKYLYDEETKSLKRCCYRGEDKQIVQNPIPIVGFLDDYAFLIRGLLDLYESTYDVSWLNWAEQLQDTQNEKFWDDNDFGYFTSSAGDESVLIRVKEDQDGAEPCGNSIAVHNLLRLGGYLDRSDFKTKAEGILAAYSERLLKVPIALPEMTSALMLYHDSPLQIFVVGPRSNQSTSALLDVVRSRFIPGKLLILADGPDGTSSNLHTRLDVLSRLKMQEGRPTAYVCRHTACSLPVNSPEQLEELLDDEHPRPHRQIHGE